MIWAIAAAVILVLLVIGVAGYNRLISLTNRRKNAYAQIDVQLKRRYDLIPNLVETAKAYMAHEKQTLEAVISARGRAIEASAKAAADPANAAAIQGVVGAENMLLGALGKFLAIAESYPDLKANQTMATLMEELTSTENRVAFARQAYNDAVMTYNTARQSFPTVIIAGIFAFTEAQLFQLDSDAERAVPRVAV